MLFLGTVSSCPLGFELSVLKPILFQMAVCGLIENS